MKRKSAIGILLLATTLSASAQKKLNMKPREVEWEEKPVLHPVPPEYYGEPAIVLLQDVDIDYKFEGRQTNAYYTFHRIVKVLDEKGIESFNSIAFSVNSRTRVPSVKARTILPGGKVQDIAKDMIKVTRDEYGRHKIVIAMEGVEKNAEIEVLVKEVRPGYDFGSEQFQLPVPIVSAHFRMSYPKEMLFEEKGYNGFPHVPETMEHNRRHMNVALSNIPALEPEPSSFYALNCMRVEYRLHDFVSKYDNDTLRKENTWEQLARSINNEYYPISDTERKAVNRYLSDIGVHPGGNEMENIKKIENSIKGGIVLYPYVDDERGDMLDSIIAKKEATSKGYIRLFAACFAQAKVKHELGMAGNRTESRFDKDFENWDNLENYVFYFPNQKKYLAPTSNYFRCPMVPYYVASSRGVFSLIEPNGHVNGPMMEVRTIKPLSPADNVQNIAAAVSFNDDMDAKVDISYAYSGYSSADLRSSLLLETKDKEKELVDKVVTIADVPSDIVNYTIANEDIDNYYTNKPLEITATVNANNLVEKAGDKYLLKIGEIIGSHQNLTNDKTRVMPVDLKYPQLYTRTITVNVPKGYKVLNPDALHMESEYVDRNLNALVSFKSEYTLVPDKKKGDKLVVTITEKYPQTHFSPSEFDRYRQVVNTGADFGNVSLLLAKKG